MDATAVPAQRRAPERAREQCCTRANAAGLAVEHYDDYSDADPGSIGWALDRQIFRWVVPFHDGAVRAYKELGVWTEEDQAHNDQLIARQEVLAEAWQSMDSSLEGEAFEQAWRARRIEALSAAGFDPIWQ